MLIKKIGTVALALVLCLSFIVYSHAISPVLNISGSHEIENNHSLDTIKMTFVLTAADETMPMPEGTVGGVKKVTVKAGSKFEFGEIHYDKPGQYMYTVSRDIIKTDNLKQDDSVYTVYVSVFSDGEMTVVYAKKDTEAKPDELKYVDTYIKKDPTPTSTTTTSHTTGTKHPSIRSLFQTGDVLSYVVIASLLLVIALISVFAYRRKR